MESSLLRNRSRDLEKVIGELNRGREFAFRLREMIKKPVDVDEDAYIELVGKLLGSFSETLSVLSSGECVIEVSQKSTEDCKSSLMEDGRGRYKRRRAVETSIKETSTLVDDGHAWRKYGEKQILNVKYPRKYYRCSHKFDDGCQANKQVQRIQENPPLFQITYYSHHTCKTSQSFSNDL